MNDLNPGDLCLIIKAGNCPQFLGSITTVIRHVGGKTATRANGEFITLPEHTYEIEPPTRDHSDTCCAARDALLKIGKKDPGDIKLLAELMHKLESGEVSK